MDSVAIICGVYFGIGLLVTIFVKRDIPFTEGTTLYEKMLGLALMIVLWPIVLCVLTPDDRTP